jgi:hypothetical protein
MQLKMQLNLNQLNLNQLNQRQNHTYKETQQVTWDSKECLEIQQHTHINK